MKKNDNHILAMKHFRAAWCLDPTYLPARENMSNFSSFERMHRFFYEESDCSKSKQKYEIKYGSRPIAHVVEKNKIYVNGGSFMVQIVCTLLLFMVTSFRLEIMFTMCLLVREHLQIQYLIRWIIVCLKC